MNRWCSRLRQLGHPDTACFRFRQTPDAWAMVEPWAHSDGEFTRRAGFALLWALALHDTAALDARFADALPLIEAHADDPRPLVGKAQTMALRAIVQKRPGVRVQVEALVRRLLASDDAATAGPARSRRCWTAIGRRASAGAARDSACGGVVSPATCRFSRRTAARAARRTAAPRTHPSPTRPA